MLAGQFWTAGGVTSGKYSKNVEFRSRLFASAVPKNSLHECVGKISITFTKALKSVQLTIYSDMEATTLLCSTVTDSYPRDSVSTSREGIILIVVARRHCHGLHIGSWELPLVSEHDCGLVRLKFFYSVDWTHDPWIRVNCKVRQKFEKFKLCVLWPYAILIGRYTDKSQIIRCMFQERRGTPNILTD